jgi:Fe-S-cluster-containing hydrogenase component 2
MSADWTPKELKRILTKYTAVTIPVGISVVGNTRILNMDEIENIVKGADTIAVENCGCRERLKRCDRPVDVCLSVNRAARDSIKHGSARRISPNEAMDVLKRSNEAGLVHVTYTIKNRNELSVICSCCACCCHNLAALTRFGMHDAIVESDYVSTHDRGLCTDCGTCVDRCQFGARQLRDSSLIYDESRCFGCGVCIGTCPSGAISLRKRVK